MSTSVMDTGRKAATTAVVKGPSSFGELEGYQIRRLALATAVLSWGGLYLLLG